MEKMKYLKKHANILRGYLSMFLSIVVAAISLFVPFTTSAYETSGTDTERFADVPENNKAYDALLELKANGIIPTPADNRFHPGTYMKRGDFVIYLSGLMGWEQISASKSSFTDVRSSSPYYSFVEAAVLHGAVSGDSGLFRPNSYITKAEIAEMLVKAMGYETLAAEAASTGTTYSDLKQGKHT
jgi:hypothetical protein